MDNLKRFLFFLIPFSLFVFTGYSQPLSGREALSRKDTLRGTIGGGRSWWNVTKYTIDLHINIADKYIYGYNEISFTTNKLRHDSMQIDLQAPMQIDSVINPIDHSAIPFERDGNVYWLSTGTLTKNARHSIRVYFKGHPKIAVRPPWDGGWIFTKDEKGRTWISTAAQGLGASSWLPCKDHQSDEPDDGVVFTIHVPDSLSAISNGRLTRKVKDKNGTTGWTWTVTQPINTYLITPYIGHYTNFNDTLQGEKGLLDIGYWVLDYNLAKAKSHFAITKEMLRCFEYWMGPYPFYEDSYKLVDAPHLGMEHQSAVAYGNKYLNGYMGSDRSGTGWGKDWDFIIVHESGHEWYANNITSKDIADMWIHEGFTTYSEALFVQCRHGLQAANEYVIGQRRHIQNDIPVIGQYGVNKEGSSDMYDKGANMIHMIRQIINDDNTFRNILRGMNKDFYHQTVTTKQIEDYMIKKSGKDLQKIFDQYLRTTSIPELSYTIKGNKIVYQWKNCVKGFNMPVRLDNGKWLYPKDTPQQKDSAGLLQNSELQVSPSFYITVKNTGQ